MILKEVKTRSITAPSFLTSSQVSAVTTEPTSTLKASLPVPNVITRSEPSPPELVILTKLSTTALVPSPLCKVIVLSLGLVEIRNTFPPITLLILFVLYATCSALATSSITMLLETLLPAASLPCTFNVTELFVTVYLPPVTSGFATKCKSPDFNAVLTASNCPKFTASVVVVPSANPVIFLLPIAIPLSLITTLDVSLLLPIVTLSKDGVLDIAKLTSPLFLTIDKLPSPSAGFKVTLLFVESTT